MEGERSIWVTTLLTKCLRNSTHQEMMSDIARERPLACANKHSSTKILEKHFFPWIKIILIAFIMLGQTIAVCRAQTSLLAQVDPDESLRWIPMAQDGHRHIVISVIVNGRSMSALVDSGFRGTETLAIKREAREQLNLRPIASKRVRGYDGEYDADVVNISTFKVGGFTIKDQRAVVV